MVTAPAHEGIQVRISFETHQRIKAEAERQGKKLHRLIDEAIVKYLEAQGAN